MKAYVYGADGAAVTEVPNSRRKARRCWFAFTPVVLIAPISA